MKLYSFPGLLFCAAMISLLTSCGSGGNEEKSGTDTTTAKTTTNTTTPEVVNTIITTPQNMMVAIHKVANFAKWKASYDEHDSMRLANGIHSYVVGRGVEDSNMVLVALKADDMTKAKAFAKDPSLKKAMQKGGVTGAPSISFVTLTWQDTADLNASIVRSRTSYTVKDWDAWQKAFTEGREERMANGVMDRAYGHDADDNKKVSLVVAITDTAKANAYWKSDMLKKRREAGGVASAPTRFVYRVVQRY